MKYRVEFAKWVKESGFAYNETIDNVDELMSADDLAACYGEYASDEDGGEIRLVENETNITVCKVFVCSYRHYVKGIKDGWK